MLNEPLLLVNYFKHDYFLLKHCIILKLSNQIQTFYMPIRMRKVDGKLFNFSNESAYCADVKSSLDSC